MAKKKIEVDLIDCVERAIRAAADSGEFFVAERLELDCLVEFLKHYSVVSVENLEDYIESLESDLSAANRRE